MMSIPEHLKHDLKQPRYADPAEGGETKHVDALTVDDLLAVISGLPGDTEIFVEIEPAVEYRLFTKEIGKPLDTVFSRAGRGVCLHMASRSH